MSPQPSSTSPRRSARLEAKAEAAASSKKQISASSSSPNKATKPKKIIKRTENNSISLSSIRSHPVYKELLDRLLALERTERDLLQKVTTLQLSVTGGQKVVHRLAENHIELGMVIDEHDEYIEKLYRREQEAHLDISFLRGKVSDVQSRLHRLEIKPSMEKNKAYLEAHKDLDVAAETAAERAACKLPGCPCALSSGTAKRE
ncbi:hypothetical protein QBC35DRAFT_470152 [Podospora australis]|uniref:Uncharacterized protein n=1 Tax=Podospora australis TaxID=1536484 RepID=A0AAN6X1I0_9PEZI|nr:hypothetical protein QBC35DRAFT_470152 [Podospora australis]